MKKLLAAVLSVAVALSLSPALSSAQSSSCPAEVTQAKDMLSKKTASVKPDEIQAPRSLAGARQNEAQQAPRGNQNLQAPRGNQDVQAPRSLAGARQDIEAPRGNQDLQAPRGNQNVQAPRGNQDLQAPRTSTGATATAQAPRADMTKAASLVKEAEAACKVGNMTLASDKAKAALAILK
ncbi:MAG TPA: hypothetical protein VGT00_12725 [Methylomirabilota bacterium]|nr:hypothetical protein [Methylomirabilota bacterium]